MRCVYVRQPQPLGLGHAVGCAAHLIDEDEPFAVILPDDLIDGAGVGCLRQMLVVHQAKGAAVLALEHALLADVSRYGVVAVSDEDERPLKITGIVEKPLPQDAPSRWTVVGRYILTSDVMRELSRMTPGSGGEIQLTDAIAAVLKDVPTYGLAFSGKRFDCGAKRGFLEANLHYGFQQE